MELYDYTSLGIAILDLFDELKNEINEQYPILQAGYVKAYIFGGAAIHIYTNARFSDDVDAQLDAIIKLDTDIILDYKDENGEYRTLALDTNFNDTFGLIHPDYRKDAIPLRQNLDSPLWTYLALPVDIAVSKVARFVEIDRTDIRILAEKNLITENEFVSRAEEALLYWVGNDMMLKYNIRDARKIISNASKL